MNQHRELPVTYFNHNEQKMMQQYIAALPPEEPVYLVGHSWGAHSAAQVIALAARPVDLLITIDPVGRSATDDFVEHVTTWINVLADPSPSNRGTSNTIRSLDNEFSRTYGNLPIHQATDSYDLNFRHAHFEGMMNFTPAGRTSPLQILHDRTQQGLNVLQPQGNTSKSRTTP